MVLAIGLVVDDAIVVVENIHRHIEEGLKPVDAAIVGMREIFGPIVSMTMTLAAVYAPIGFTEGLTGTLFREFAFTLAGAVVISGIVAVTLSPMMSSRLLKPHGGGRGFAGFVDRSFTRLENWYGRRLSGSLDYRARDLPDRGRHAGHDGVHVHAARPPSWRPRRTRARSWASCNAPKYATSDYTQLFASAFTKPPKDKIPEIDDTFMIAGIGRRRHGLHRLQAEGMERAAQEGGGDQAGHSVHARLQRRRAGLRLLAAGPAGRRAAACRSSTSLRTIGDPSQAYEVAEQVRKKAHAVRQVHRRPELDVVRNAAGPHHGGPRPRGRARRAGQRDRGHAGRARRRRHDLQVRPRQPQLRRRQPGARRRTASTPSGWASITSAPRTATMVPISALVQIETERGARRHRAVQPAELRDALGAAAAGRDDERGPEDAALDRRAGDAAGLLRGLRRPVAAGGAGGQLHRHGVRARRHRHLPGAGGAVRELPRPVHHHDVGAALDVRRHRLPQSRAGDAEHLHGGRA